MSLTFKTQTYAEYNAASEIHEALAPKGVRGYIIERDGTSIGYIHKRRDLLTTRPERYRTMHYVHLNGDASAVKATEKLYDARQWCLEHLG